MFAYLEGTLVEKHPTLAVVDVNGVGYELTIPLSTSQALPAPGSRIKLLTHFHVREDLQQIFGFKTEDERSLFKLLLSVSGIGPKLAVTILSGLSPQELFEAVQEQNLLPLNAISGIGKKTAERILLELKGKIPAGWVEKGKKSSSPLGDEKLTDAILALISLGYKKANAQEALKKVLGKERNLSVEDLIRESLKII